LGVGEMEEEVTETLRREYLLLSDFPSTLSGSMEYSCRC